MTASTFTPGGSFSSPGEDFWRLLSDLGSIWTDLDGFPVKSGVQERPKRRQKIDRKKHRKNDAKKKGQRGPKGLKKHGRHLGPAECAGPVGETKSRNQILY